MTGAERAADGRDGTDGEGTPAASPSGPTRAAPRSAAARAARAAREAVFTGIADPTRRRILDHLREVGEAPSSAVAAAFPEMTRQGVSRHLGVLLEARLVQVEPVGRERRYRLDPAGFEILVRDWLGFYEDAWRRDLARLKRAAEAEAGTLD